MGLIKRLFKKKTEQTEIRRVPGVTVVLVASNGGGRVLYFEQTEDFEVYFFKDGERIRKEMIQFPKEHIDGRIERFRQIYVDAVISRGFGPKAQHQLRRYQIKMYTFDGGPAAAARAYQRGELRPV